VYYTMNIVVARYNENLDWTNELKNVIVYNKGIPLNIQNELFLPNVGREGHTYYTYICDNYDNLGDYTMFLQGNPFEYQPPDIMSKIIQYNNLEFDLSLDFIFLSNIADCNLSGCPHHRGLPLKEVYEKLFKEYKEELPFNFGVGAQFIVSKKSILKRPKTFYEEIVKLLEYNINPIEGFVIERFHKLIFQ
jgi:hypothetical protein